MFSPGRVLVSRSVGSEEEFGEIETTPKGEARACGIGEARDKEGWDMWVKRSQV